MLESENLTNLHKRLSLSLHLTLIFCSYFKYWKLDGTCFLRPLNWNIFLMSSASETHYEHNMIKNILFKITR